MEMVRKKKGRGLLLRFVVGIVFFGCSLAAAAPGTTSDRPIDCPHICVANIGFGVVINSEEILELLNRYAVSPQAAFMWVNGRGGTYRTYERKTPAEFLGKAKSLLTEIFEKSLKANQFFLKQLVEKHTRETFIADEELQAEARYLLTDRILQERTLPLSTESKAFIFSLEITGNNAQLEQLRKNEKVKAFNWTTEVKGKGMRPYTPKPVQYQKQYINPDAMHSGELYNPEVRTMGVGELYQRVILTLEKSKKEEDKK